jgi:hypothetical protein
MTITLKIHDAINYRKSQVKQTVNEVGFVSGDICK